MDYNLQKNQNAEQTYHSIRNSIVSAQHRLSTAVNSAMVTTYWEIGEQIFKACGENDRAEYGKKLLEYLSEQLTAEFGKGFDKSNLRKMRQFYCTFPIRDTLCPELSWSHYRVLMRINDEQARRFYMEECAKAGNPDIVYKFTSTSKVSFPGSGVAAIGTSKANIADIKKQMTIQTIGHDKLNQLRHVRFFKDMQGMYAHMRKHADILRPKFEKVWEVLDRELGGLEIGTWTKPVGGYFISFDSMEGCAKAIVAKAKEAGLVLTGAGATYPYGKDPKDSNIRIAPSFPTVEELEVAVEIFVLSVKLVSIDKLLEA